MFKKALKLTLNNLNMKNIVINRLYICQISETCAAWG